MQAATVEPFRRDRVGTKRKSPIEGQIDLTQYDKEQKAKQKKTKQETVNVRWRKNIAREKGTACYFCGAKPVEYHHLIAIKDGGTNDPKNIIPLCHYHHRLIHRQKVSKYVTGRGGRHTKISQEDANPIFDMYCGGEIGRWKLHELIGYSHKTEMKNLRIFQKYLESKGIEDMRNNIDVIGTTTNSLKDGMQCGWIKYKDGRQEWMYYKDTGMNDVEYKRRGDTRRKNVKQC